VLKDLMKEKWFKISLLITGAIVLIVLMEFFLVKAITFLLPFLLILLFTSILSYPVDYLEKKKVPRWLGTIISLVAFLSTLIGILTIIIMQLINGSKFLLLFLTEKSEKIILFIESFYTKNILPSVDTAKETFSTLNKEQKDDLQSRALEVGEVLIKNITSFLQKIVEIIPGFIGLLPELFTGLIFVSLATFFLTKDKPKISQKIKSKLTNIQLENLQKINLEAKKTIIGFVRAQLTLIGMTFIIVLIGLLILKVKYAFLIAFIIGFVDLIPYLGTGFVFFPWIIVSFLIGAKNLAIGLVILYVLVVIQRNIIEPKVLSSNIGLDPLSTLIAIYLGFAIFGVLGLIIGPVMLIIFKMFYGIYKDGKNVKKIDEK
jgi:sporulation integral membrane protein YtvI